MKTEQRVTVQLTRQYDENYCWVVRVGGRYESGWQTQAEAARRAAVLRCESGPHDVSWIRDNVGVAKLSRTIRVF